VYFQNEFLWMEAMIITLTTDFGNGSAYVAAM